MIKLRKFCLSDLKEVMEIEKVSFPEPYSKSYFEKLYQRYPEGFFVAVNESRIVGYAIGLPKNESAEIISIAVDLNWRKKGTGTALVIFLINHFKTRRKKTIIVHVRSKNKVGIAFYRKLNFKILKAIKNYYRNGDNAYLMRKEI